MIEPGQPRLLLLNGPNLNMLGRRDPGHYGTFTLADAEQLARDAAAEAGFTLDCYQTTHEGDMLEKIHAAMDHYRGLLINAGAWTHTSYALRDALELTRLPVMEIHISDVQHREAFRRVSVIEDVCMGKTAGLGLDSYRVATEKMCAYLRSLEYGR